MTEDRPIATTGAVLSQAEAARVVAARSQQRHGDFSFVTLPDLPVVDGLITKAEERYLYWLTSSQYTGQGAVVELGSWFGRSAIALGAGLRDSGRSTTLHCFDRFMWRSSFDSSTMIADVGGLPDGGDFMPFFLDNVLPVYPHVRATKVTIDELRWDGPLIELFHVDAPKTFADLSTTFLAFGPHLVPGHTLLMLQDFFFAPAYPIALTVAMMTDTLRLVHTVTGTSTAAFVLEAPMPTGPVPKTWKYFEQSDKVVARRFADLVAQIPDEQRSLVEPALAFYFLDRNKLEEARKHMRRIEFSPLGRRRLDFLRGTSAWGPRLAKMLD